MAGSRKFWRIQASATNPKSADLILYGPISEYSWWGDEVTPKQFAKDLKDLGDIDELHVRVNSGGGDVFAGQTIYSLLRSFKAKKIVHIDGLAASIASVIVMAGDTVIMPKNATLMIHNPAVWARGEASELREWADILDKIRDGIIEVYQAKSGMEREELVALMDKETWMNADEAKEYGFVDEVEELQVAASVNAGVLNLNGVTFDLAAFKVKPPFAATEPKKQNNRGGKPMEITAQVVAEQHPQVHKELVEQGRQAGAQAERARIKTLNDLAVPGNTEVAQIIAAAIESGDTAEATALKVVAAVKKTGAQPPAQPGNQTELANLIKDAGALSGIEGAATPAGDEAKAEAELKQAAENIAKGAEARRR